MPPRRVKISPPTPSSAAQSKPGGAKLPAYDANTPFPVVGKTKTSGFPSLTDGQMERSGLAGLGGSDEDLKGKGKAKEKTNINDSSQDEDEDEDEDTDEDEDEDGMEWEDVFQTTIEPAPATGASSSKQMGDLVLTLENSKLEISAGGKKKGASAQQRRIRAVTHCLHVQFLLFHGTVRNGWICDPGLHAILLSHLSPGIMRDVERFQTQEGKKSSRETVTKGATDPILKLLGILVHWWKKKFTVDKPGMRKNGYKTLSRFQDEKEQESEKLLFTTGNRGRDGQETHTIFMNQGEKVENLEHFRELAMECKGSRDTGAMLFTALLRAIGLETRMIFSLQPLGFGFTERESFTETRLPTEEEAREQLKRTAEDRDFVTSNEDSEDYDSGGFIREESILDSTRKAKKPAYDKDLPYPIFWSEIYSATSNKWITVESLVLTVFGSSPDLLAKFEPKGRKAADSKQTIAYVIAYSSDGTAKDVTVRYLYKNTFPGKTKGFRIPITNIPVYDYEGRVVATHKRDWFRRVMRGYQTPEHLRSEREKEEDDELQGFILKPEKPKGEQKESIAFYKNNLDYVLERHLKREEAVKPGKSHVKTFTVGKGEKAKEEKVYSKGDIAVCKTVENWYREGIVIREGQQPLKRVKPRVATLNRKREIEEAKRDGEIVMQGLYSEEQTELYRPPPILDGRIPRNSFGNMDVYVKSMIPPGAIHLPLKGSAKLARRLGISYAEAVTGFEFKKQRAMPMIEGIVVAEENEDLLRDAWRAEEEEKKKRADGKREKTVLAMWRRFLMGLRIVTRLREEYGDADDGGFDINPFTARKSNQIGEKQPLEKDESEANDEAEEGGGFFKEDEDHDMGGGFIRDDGSEADGGGGFLNEEEEAITHGGGFEIVFDDEDGSNALSVFVPSTNALAQGGTMPLRDVIIQNEKQTSEGNTEYDSGQEIQRPTASPAARSAYFTKGIVINDAREDESSVITPNTENEASVPPGDEERPKPHAKTKIEVQIPVARATSGRKTRASKASEVLAVDIGTPSSGTRRALKRKAASGAKSKYFTDVGVAPGDGRSGKIARRK